MSPESIIAAIALAGSVIGVYIKLSTDIALLKQRMEAEEKVTDQFTSQHHDHDRRLNETVLSIERQLSEIKILIEQKMK